MPRDAVSRTAHVGTVGKNGLNMSFMLVNFPQCAVCHKMKMSERRTKDSKPRCNQMVVKCSCLA